MAILGTTLCFGMHLSGCINDASEPPIQCIKNERKPYAITPGVYIPYDPTSIAEWQSIFPDLVTMVRIGQIEPEEARNFIRFKKTQLGLPEPNETPIFDQLIADNYQISKLIRREGYKKAGGRWSHPASSIKAEKWSSSMQTRWPAPVRLVRR